MRRRYLKAQLILRNNKITKFAGFYSTASDNQFWFLDWIVNDLKRKAKKLSDSVSWLTYRIEDCDKPEEERSKIEIFDIEAIKQNVTPDKILGIQPAMQSQDKEFYCCPLHKEKTPSFCWNKREKYFKCFGCGESGDIINFYMKLNNCNFRTACRELQNIV